ncbi:type III secretion system FlhB-like substrate exporter [Kitasatospora sp. MAA4]|uniref:hypothetical protein n=1 Tax=Kitasatospora sp. MAA4 TaxID=3035093 RepID=UPI0024758750|nr:hypothetical protein [Kitasatospora sp. MAA4]MDH6135553.1 type III secretion system FlhB-like substrate exporter [Kitasatospora sp. MAA4]
MREVDTRRRELISEAARRAVGAVAPEESVIFEPLAAQFVSRGEVPRERRYTDGIIASGWDAAEMLISPLALTLATSLYNRLLDNVSDEVLKRGGHGVQRAWRRLRRADRAVDSPSGPAEAPEATAGATALRDQLLSQARQLGIPEEQAQPLVDALLAAAEDQLPAPGSPVGDDAGAA